MKKLLVLTASTSLPRPEPQVCYFEQTWPGLLEREFKVYQCSKGGSTSKDLLDISWYSAMYLPNIVILQVGLVDCAPRSFSLKEITVFRYLWLTRYPFKVVNKYFGKFVRNIRKKRNLSVLDYQNNVQSIVNRFGDGVVVYAIGNMSNDVLEKLNPGITSNVNEYNAVLKSIFQKRYICLDNMPETYFMSDFQHPNEIGHQFIHDRICEFLKRDNLL